jgi:hypothetical protein
MVELAADCEDLNQVPCEQRVLKDDPKFVALQEIANVT